MHSHGKGLRDGRVSQKVEPLETSRKQDSLSSSFCSLVPVLGGISIYSSLHSSGLSPYASHRAVLLKASKGG